MNINQVEKITIKRFKDGILQVAQDSVVVEEPLEIQLVYSSLNGKMTKSISVTMRTPGNDEELARGFLFTEGIISGYEIINQVKHLASDQNRIQVILIEEVKPILQNSERNFYSTSSCGICGKASIDAIQTNSVYPKTIDSIRLNPLLLNGLPEILYQQQEIFEHTGGIHACGLFTLDAEIIMVREDVGRHNALDKLIGAALKEGLLPLDKHLLLLSGRASFELLQKASMAGVKVVAAVGAPSSLAIEMAKEAGITLIGFLRQDRFNIYTGFERIES